MRRAIVLAASLLIGASGTALADGGQRSSGTADVYTFSSGRGHLGLVVLGLTDELKHYFGSGKDGVLVGTIEAGSPAEKAGVKIGDVLADVDGKPVDDAGDVLSLLGGKKKGDAIGLTVIRAHMPLMLTAKLADDVAPTPKAFNRADRWFPGMGMPGMGMPGMGTPFGFDDDGMKQLEQRMQQLEQRMHKLDGA